MSTKNQGKSASRRPQDFSSEEKLALVLEASQLDEEEALGRFLRERGLHRATLERWRSQMLQGLAPPARTGHKKASPEARRVRELERELRRKEKALAEASALLLLKKKVAQMWGDEEDDMTPRSGK
jgi:transposase-like protein